MVTAQRTRLTVEELEGRWLPQAVPTILVTGLGDPGILSNLAAPRPGHAEWTAPNLRSALANAGQTGSTTDTILLPNGVITLRQGVLQVGAGLRLTIEAPAVTVIDAHFRSQILHVHADSTVVAQNLFFTSGEATGGKNGGAIVNDGDLTLIHCRVINSLTVAPVGGPGGYGGGGIDNEGTLDIQDSVIAHNRVVGVTKIANPTAVNGMYGQKVVGGGILNNGALTVVNTTFSGNLALGGSISGNQSGIQAGDAYGGAIAVLEFSVRIVGCTFANNQAIAGNIILTRGGIPGGDVSAGSALGGALYQQATNAFSLDIFNSTFAFNAALGGSAFVLPGAKLTAHAGAGSGGGLYLGLDRNSVSLVFDTVAYNRTAAGLGPNPMQIGPAGIASALLVVNDFGPINGIVFGQGVFIWNTLVANNTAAGVGAFDVAGFFASYGHNLIGSVDGAFGFDTSAGDLLGTRAAPLDPGLARRLRNNGGLTQTLALLPGSLAIDHGDNAAADFGPDQRGVTRPRGAFVDIGAFEF